MALSHTQSELRLAVANTLELSYSTDQELTTELFREAGPLKVSIDHRGNATLEGNAGRVSFSASERVHRLGMKLRRATISMRVDDEGKIKYTASFDLYGGVMAAASGVFDVEKFITTCSGFLCRNFRDFLHAIQARDAQLLEAIR